MSENAAPLYRHPNAVALPPAAYREYVLLRAIFTEPLVRNPHALADVVQVGRICAYLGLHALCVWLRNPLAPGTNRAWEYMQLDSYGCYPDGEAYTPGRWAGTTPADDTARAMRQALVAHIDRLAPIMAEAYAAGGNVATPETKGEAHDQ